MTYKSSDDLDAELVKINLKLEQLGHKELLLTNKAIKTSRKQETHKKILLGTLVQNMMESDTDFKEEVMTNMDRFLTRDDERELFGLDLLT